MEQRSRTVLVVAAVCAMALASSAATAAGDPQAGKQKAEQCKACHGLDGNSTSPQFPVLAGQHADYLVRALEQYKAGGRKNPIMAPQAAGLSAQDRADLAAWFSSQSGHLTVIEHKK